MSKYKIKCLNKIAKIALDKFDSDYEIVTESPEAILVRSASMHEQEIDKSLLCVARAGAGVNNIPLKEMANKGVVVFNTPGANANGVKELVIAGLLLASRDIVGGINWVNNNKDKENINTLVEKEKSKFAGVEVIHKKILIIGLGVIGVMVANSCLDLGMEVYGYDPFLSISNAMHLSKDIKYITKLETILKDCDYVSIHVPLSEKTKGMINKEQFSLMKKDVILLNFARDLLVNEEDLKEALNDKIKCYITDFPNDNIVKLDKVIAIPHLGASTTESEDNCAMMAVNEIKDYLENGNIKNSVNYPNCDAGILQASTRITINHLNIPGMINKFTEEIINHSGNIVNMVNKSLGEFAYTVFDIDGVVEEQLVKYLDKITGVLKVRII